LSEEFHARFGSNRLTTTKQYSKIMICRFEIVPSKQNKKKNKKKLLGD
jgi:hypothetical protein